MTMVILVFSDALQNEINVVLADEAGDRESPKNLDTSYSENLPSDQINTESIDV